MSERDDISALIKMSVSVIEEPERRRHGGRRPGAGRKKTGKRAGGPHRRRPELAQRHPVHVTLRMTERHRELRRRDVYRHVHACMQPFFGRADFRIVHASIQRSHLHLLVEAANRDALRANVHSFEIRLARRLNGESHGKVFAHRYHAVQITTARRARSALAYVLNNWRRHREDCKSGPLFRAPVDAYSSGVTFAGWSERLQFSLPDGYVPLPTSPPRTQLLAHEWKRFGRIDPFERPGPVWG